MSHYLETIEAVASGVVAANASEVDRAGRFPRASIEALRDAGLLGLISATEVGGMGEGLRAAGMVVERLARECGSTAMIMCMHYTASAVIEAFGSAEVRKATATGKHLLAVAFSEAGSRSHFWAPLSTATTHSDGVHRRHDALAYTAGLNEEVFDALILLAAGSWKHDALRVGWERVQKLQHDMDEGRQKRLARLGFDAAESVSLSALHTRNFM